MHRRWTGLLSIALAAGVAGNLAAQQGVALTPFIGYTIPSGNLVQGPFLTLKAKSGITVGAIGELSLAKSLGIAAYAMSTVGLSQIGTYDFPGSGASIEQGMATTQFGASLMLRPLGRNPNGSPKVFYLEAGAALNRFSFAAQRDRSDSTRVHSWNGSGLVGLFGGGFTFRVGPRATAVLFARYNLALKEYESDGLTDWNSGCAPNDASCIDPGKKVNILTIGLGLRTGR